jgi:hypothetical protein
MDPYLADENFAAFFGWVIVVSSGITDRSRDEFSSLTLVSFVVAYNLTNEQRLETRLEKSLIIIRERY